MTQGGDVAYAGQRPPLPEEFKAQPAEARPLVCPMCRKGDRLVVDIPITEHRYIRAYDVGVSTPEWDMGDEIGVTAPPAQTPTAIRCQHCNWKFTGDNPLKRLVPADAR